MLDTIMTLHGVNHKLKNDNLRDMFISVHRHTDNGKTWYRMCEIFDALGIPDDTRSRRCASALIGKSHKKYIWQIKRSRSGKLYYDKRYAYIDYTGVECVVIRYGKLYSRAELMSYLLADVCI